MRRLTIGIVDYGVGNLASIRHALHALDYRCRASSQPTELDKTDLLLLPGVGAYPHAMRCLRKKRLDVYVQNQARTGKPIIGICLGMQLLADSSTEISHTEGLGLIPGQVMALTSPDWHIGWNDIEVTRDDALFSEFDGMSVYFNHSYVFNAPTEHVVAVARFESCSTALPIAVRHNNIVGIQFHLEKSQSGGRALLTKIIEGLCHA